MARGLKTGSCAGRKAQGDRFAENADKMKYGDIGDELRRAKCDV